MPSRQRRRVFAAIGITVLPLMVLGAYTVWDQLREEEQSVTNARVQLARASAFAVESFLDGHVSTARSLALQPSLIRLAQSPGLNEFARRVALANPEWEGLGVVGPDGYSVAGSLGRGPVFVGDRPYFKEAVATGRPVVSSALIGRLSGKATVVIAAPFEVEGGRRGILAVPLPTDRFGESLRARVATPEVELTVIDRSSQVFIGPDPKGLRSLIRASGPEIDAVLKGDVGSMRVVRDGVGWLVAYAPVAPYGFGVLIAEPEASAFAPVRALAATRLAVLAAILGSVLGLGWFVGGWLAGAYEREAAARARAEELAAALQRSVTTRDDFLASASHDLRNPLSTIQAAGETLARSVERTGSVPPDRLDACIQHIQGAARRMARLLDTFMDVARLQLGQPLELNRERRDLSAIVRHAVAECQQTTTRHRLSCEAPGELFAHIDGERVHRVLSNVIGNAIKYSPDGGDIEVELAREARAAVIAVSDLGIGIPPGDVHRIFTRFERGSNAAARFAGAGIGLSGAKQIVEQHGGTISVRSRSGPGTTVTITLPIEERST